MATAGVIIASAVGEEDATTVAVAVETAVDVFMQLIVEVVGHRQHASAAVAGLAAPRTPQQRVVAVADRTVADRTVAANTISQ